VLECAGGRRGKDDVLHDVCLNAQAEGGARMMYCMMCA